MQAQTQYALDVIWPPVESTMKTALEKNEYSVKTHMQAYTNVYNHCSMGPRSYSPSSSSSSSAPASSSSNASFGGEDLYNRVTEFIKKHLQEIGKRLVKNFDSCNKNPDQICQYYATEWRKYTLAINPINNIYAYINKNWIAKAAHSNGKRVYEIKKLLLVEWRDEIFSRLKDQLRASVMELVTRDRDGEQINQAALAAALGSFVALSSANIGIPSNEKNKNILDVYTKELEIHFLAESELYFTMRSSESITNDSITDYLLKVETWLAQETTRITTYFHPDSTLPQLTRIFDQIFLEKNKERIASEFPALIEGDRIPEISRMYMLMNRIAAVGGLDPMRVEFENYIHSSGLKAVASVMNNQDKSKAYVEVLLQHYRKYSDITENCFKSDTGFVAALDKGFRKLINDNAITSEAKSATKSPELLAKYSNSILKKGGAHQTLEEAEVERLLDDLMLIFKYVEDKDVFMTFYIHNLANRLIYSTSVSKNLEQYVLSKMKSACGYEYVSKLQKMFNDIQLSEDLGDKFREYSDNESGTSKIDFGTLVLANGTWPLQRVSEQYKFAFTPEVDVCTRTFEAFYTGSHAGKKLSWLHHMSKGEVKINFTKTNATGYTLQATGEQLAVLLQFNYTAAPAGELQILTVAELLERTGIPLPALTSIIKLLLKFKLVGISPQLADPAADPIEPSHKLALNKGFKPPKGKVKFNLNALKTPEAEAGSKNLSSVDQDSVAQQQILEERKLTTQAAIVRIMKARKTLTHAQLVTEVVDQQKGKFKPHIQLVKKCVEMLIEKEYLKRSNGKDGVYEYLA